MWERSFGKAMYENGGVYEGEFQDDHRWGWGEHRFPDGSVYEGEWFDDMIEGALMVLGSRKPFLPLLWTAAWSSLHCQLWKQVHAVRLGHGEGTQITNRLALTGQYY